MRAFAVIRFRAFWRSSQDGTTGDYPFSATVTNAEEFSSAVTP